MSAEQRSQAYEGLLNELQEERVSALRRISRTLEMLIQELHACRRQLAGLEGEARERQMTQWHELHAQAQRYRWYLEVQREALGLRHHHRLDEFYQIPRLDSV